MIYTHILKCRARHKNRHPQVLMGPKNQETAWTISDMENVANVVFGYSLEYIYNNIMSKIAKYNS